MRSALVAEKDNFLRSFVDKAFNAVWVDSLNMNDDEVFLKFIKEQDINSDLFTLKYNDSVIISFNQLFNIIKILINVYSSEIPFKNN